MGDFFQRIKSDASWSAFTAGIIAVLVGLTSSAVIVFQAAQSAGLNSLQASSWLGSLCLGMGVLAIVLSYKFKAPVLTAWSTAGAAILVTALPGIPIGEAIGAFFVSASLIFLCGITGLFEKIMNRISIPLASALLAGVLVQFSISAFLAFKTQPLLLLSMFVVYVLGLKFFSRWTMLSVLIVGVLVAGSLGLLRVDEIVITATQFNFTWPEFSLRSCLSIGVPLFVVTMASQNLTGYSLLRFHGYKVPLSPLLAATGFTNMITAFFGGFTITLAAITATIGMQQSVHPDPQRRYFSGITAGLLYIFVGLFAATVTTLFAAFPKELIQAIAGLALLTTIANALDVAVKDTAQRNAAVITFVVAASGLSLFSIGSAFWGLLAGIFAQALSLSRTKV